MEMERVTEFPMTNMDLRPRKRQRLGWDNVPQPTKGKMGKGQIYEGKMEISALSTVQTTVHDLSHLYYRYPILCSSFPITTLTTHTTHSLCATFLPPSMASISKLRLNSAHSRLLYSARFFSSILNPDATAPLSSKQKSRVALSLLKSEKNPERILDICRAASLTPDSHLDRIALSVAISKLTESKYFEGIRLFIEELKTRPDLQNERFISHAIVLYGQAGLLDHAFQTFDKMPQMGVPQSAKSLNALIFACIVAKKYDEVNRVFVDFPKKYGVEPNLDTYNSVIKAFSESGSSGAAYSVLAEMERKGCQPSHTTYGDLLAGFHREEKLEDVERVLEMMKNRGMKVGISTFCHLIHGFGREGNLEEVKNLFKDMRKRGYNPDSDCYFLLVSFLCQGGDFEFAFEVCKESMAKGWIPSFTIMKSLVNGLAGISKVDEARQIISEIKETFPKSNDLWNEIEEGLPK